MSQSLIVTIILIAMIISFFAGYIPMAATALAVPMLLQVTGVLSFKDAWAGFSSSTVVSLVVLFILGGILNQTTFLDDLKHFVVTKLGAGAKGKRRVLLAAMLMSVVFSTFASPISAMAIMLPIVIAIAAETGLPVKNTIKACTDVACSSNNVLPVGTALTAYITFNGYLEAAGASERFKFADPFLAKIPIFVVFFLYIYFVGFKHYAKIEPENGLQAEGKKEAKEKKDEKKRAELTPFQNKLGKILFFGSAAAMIITSTFTKNVPLKLMKTEKPEKTVIFGDPDGKEFTVPVDPDTVKGRILTYESSKPELVSVNRRTDRRICDNYGNSCGTK